LCFRNRNNFGVACGKDSVLAQRSTFIATAKGRSYTGYG